MHKDAIIPDDKRLAMEYTVEVMISEQDIAKRITELGRSINKHYRDSDSEMVLVGLLRGSFIFMADLCRVVTVSHEVDFMTASSYGGGMSSSRDVKIFKDLEEDIRGKDVLIVEDIIDSGNTLSQVWKILALRQPKSLAICTLLDKPDRREVNVTVEWVGFTIPNEFVIGYGIDYAQRYRHLPYVGKLITTPAEPDYADSVNAVHATCGQRKHIGAITHSAPCSDTDNTGR
ncbi:MAG: Xanthine phosphoribosyltransferase [Sodalis sp. Psp]|nr:Xanthine phosphoribosyltransferase [Sodalis sp. Psp]MCR3757207.1 Xanthine phosphoribosyltransferase [Sodalis sp. Ppy]